MASLMQWTWTWANSGRWWGTGKAWHAAVHGVTKSWTQMGDWTATTWRLNMILHRNNGTEYCSKRGKKKICASSLSPATSRWWILKMGGPYLAPFCLACVCRKMVFFPLSSLLIVSPSPFLFFSFLPFHFFSFFFQLPPRREWRRL